MARQFLLSIVVPPAALLTSGLIATNHVENTGLAFVNTGKSIEAVLHNISTAIRHGDWGQFSTQLNPRYAGHELGLNSFRQHEASDGIYLFRATPGAAPYDCGQAIAEWRAYIQNFESVSASRLHIHRIESWNASEVRASVRFEIIGKLKDWPEEAIDRGLLLATFSWNGDDKGGQWLLNGASLSQAERIVASAAQFRDVASTAGIDFQNRYYPPFLTQPLRFGMIRHGPGGIAAADYDNDGLYDLFVPDGVESVLFRNTGTGRFENVTAAAGLARLDGVSTAVFGDYDNDGHKDLFVSRTFKPNQLFHNNGDGTFSDVTARSRIGEDCCTSVAAWADYDNDGDLDLYVGRYLDPRKDLPTTFYARNGEPNQLYRNNGDGTFTNVTFQAGVGEKGLCLGVVWGDYDDDSYPDLYVVNDFGRNTLYHNNRDSTFSDVTVRTNTLAYGAGMNASFTDYDNDGRLDIYVTNIRSEYAWFAESPTVWRYMVNSWRQGVWYTDMPLYFEIFRQSGLEFVQVFQQMASGNTLLRNTGRGTFEDTTISASANPVGWFWGASFADFDNDGWQDVYAADGWVYGDKDTEIELDFLNSVVSQQTEYKKGTFFDPKNFGRNSWHGWERNRHLRNLGNGKFLEIGRGAGTDLLLNSRGVAVADFWNRGVMDIAVAGSDAPHALLRNEIAGGRSWLQVELRGTESNRDAIGARILVRSNGMQQMRELTAGDGYASQNSLRQHFGLGTASRADSIEVRWPKSGKVQRFENVAANRIIQVTEGAQDFEELRYKRLQ